MDQVIFTDHGPVTLKPVRELMFDLLEDYHPCEIRILIQEIRVAMLDRPSVPPIDERHLDMLKATEQAMRRICLLDNPGSL